MIATIIAEFLEQLAIAAVEDASIIAIVHDGEPSRFVVFCQKEEATFSAIVNPGQTIRVRRGDRLLIEPIDRVLMRPLVVVQNNWRTM